MIEHLGFEYTYMDACTNPSMLLKSDHIKSNMWCMWHFKVEAIGALEAILFAYAFVCSFNLNSSCTTSSISQPTTTLSWQLAKYGFLETNE